jgi:hypothetical protein
MKVWCITGIDSSDWIENVWKMYLRASGTIRSQLIVVENGDGINKWPRSLSDDVIITTSEHGVAQYINAGISKAKELADSNDWFCKLDSDDFYGDNRLSTIEKAASCGFKAAGASIFVKTPTNKLWKVESGTTDYCAMQAGLYPHGPTIAAALDVTADFPIPLETWGEDMLWVQEMFKKQIEFGALPLHGFAYCRYPDKNHAWPPNEDELRHFWTVPTFDLGPWNENIVEGKEPITFSEEIPYDGRILSQAMERLLKVKLRVGRERNGRIRSAEELFEAFDLEIQNRHNQA